MASSVMLEAGYACARTPARVRAIDVSLLDTNLLEATVRLTRLLDSPAKAPILLPLVTREMVYQLLIGEQEVRLRHLATLGEGSSPIASAVERLCHNFDQPLRVEQLARELGMSVSGFHQHFKTVTALSPLQFQKRLQGALSLYLRLNYVVIQETVLYHHPHVRLVNEEEENKEPGASF